MRVLNTQCAALLTAFCALLASAAEAAENTPAATPNYAQAYNYSLRCFTANGMLASEAKRTGSVEQQQTYNANSKLAFEGAMTLGRKLGYSNIQLNDDLDRMQREELPHLFQDGAYRRQTYAICRALGYM